MLVYAHLPSKSLKVLVIKGSIRITNGTGSKVQIYLLGDWMNLQQPRLDHVLDSSPGSIVPIRASPRNLAFGNDDELVST